MFNKYANLMLVLVLWIYPLVVCYTGHLNNYPKIKVAIRGFSFLSVLSIGIALGAFVNAHLDASNNTVAIYGFLLCYAHYRFLKKRMKSEHQQCDV